MRVLEPDRFGLRCELASNLPFANRWWTIALQTSDGDTYVESTNYAFILLQKVISPWKLFSVMAGADNDAFRTGHLILFFLEFLTTQES